MRRKLAIGVALLGLVGAAPGNQARANGPEIGINAGAMIPLSKYKRTVNEIGGTAGVSAGYRFYLSDNVALSLLAQPQFTVHETEECCGSTDGEDVAALFIAAGGPKLSLLNGPLETYLSAQGGYYRDISGPLSDEGPGVNGALGFDFHLSRGTTFGAYGRLDYAFIDAAPDSDQNRRFLLAGLALNHVFLPPEEIRVAEPPPPPPPPPPAPPAHRRIVLRGVNFDFDKATIRPDARPILDEAVRTLQDEPGIDVAVEGHTDAIGTDAYNQRLSERRANAVADYLAAGGISRGRLSVSGYGEGNPVATNETPDGRAQNRRVELRVVGE